MTHAEIAEALEVSERMVRKYVARGMPTHSLAAAWRWKVLNVRPRENPERSTRAEDDPVLAHGMFCAVINDLLNAGAMLPAAGMCKQLKVPEKDAHQILATVAFGMLHTVQVVTGIKVDPPSPGFCAWVRKP